MGTSRIAVLKFVAAAMLAAVAPANKWTKLASKGDPGYRILVPNGCVAFRDEGSGEVGTTGEGVRKTEHDNRGIQG
jgi:hypothetical protein